MNNNKNAIEIEMLEQERIASLYRHHILDTSPDVAFDRITALAAQLLKVPIALVSLVDKERIWFKSHHGLGVEQIERVPGFCATAIMSEGPYVVKDAKNDARTQNNPLVTSDFGLRFYAGVPLKSKDNQNLGMLSVIDTKSREITLEQIKVLVTLSHTIMHLMELHLAASHIQELNTALSSSHDKLTIAHTELMFESSHDGLTGLLNRGAIMNMLNQLHAIAQREGKPLFIAIIDIDHFKQINDTYGHLIGDKVLIEVARRIKHVSREATSVGRIGGEEFMLINYPCDLDEAITATQRVLDAVRDEPIFINEQNKRFEIKVTISIGYYSAINPAKMDAYALFKCADEALYKSKNSGRNAMTVGKLAIN